MPKKPADITALVATPDEQETLRALLTPNAQLDVLIPYTIDPDKLWVQMQSAVTLLNKLEGAKQKLYPVIGRMLAVYKTHPEAFQQIGFRTWDQFLTKGVRELAGLSRADAYFACKLADTFPSMSPQQFIEIGITKMKTLVQVTRESDSNCQEVMERARGMSAAELAEWAHVQEHIEKGAAVPDHIYIKCNKADADRWKEWISDARVQATVESDNAAVILMRLLDEASGEWLQEPVPAEGSNGHPDVVIDISAEARE